MPEVIGQGDAQRFRAGSRFGVDEPLLQSLLDGLSGDHLVEEGEQGTAVDEMRSADCLDAADGFHEVLGRSAADGEEAFDVQARPGLGAGVTGLFADGVEVSGPLDRSWQGFRSRMTVSGYRDC